MPLFDEAALRQIVRDAVVEALSQAARPADASKPRQDDLPPNLSDAELLQRWGGRSKTWLASVRATGELRSVRFGSRWLTSRDEVLRAERDGFKPIPNGGVRTGGTFRGRRGPGGGSGAAVTSIFKDPA